MSPRNDITFKPLVNAGISTLTLRFVMIVYTGIITLIFAITTISFTLFEILIEISVALGFIATLLFVVFILSAFLRMNDDPNILPGNRDQIKLGIISSIILIVILSLYAAVYVVFDILYYYSIISLSITMAQIILYSLIALEILNGIFILITFFVLSSLFSKFDQLRDLKIFRRFTIIFGIFLGLTHLILGIFFLLSLLAISNPIIITILSLSFLSTSIFSSIASLCQIIISVGYILIGKRLQTSQ